ncbi:predicted protein [Naegleria gruberi]|uniref:Predicted protein n=1 Tax=Naegleria gruberi TaxID=5762 RepID=D2W512_NAEGR|nr:uncharacterized protein NAEGRDRAFT_82340 [Naegleria gruberi]EFC35839.1 predicted protein [Naegleria gruberi]|eukprot:XP_002668583.1 predicted protein [Naegleria gruberi strain NEG-M]
MKRKESSNTSTKQQQKKLKRSDDFQNATNHEIDHEIATIDSEIKNLNQFKEELLIIKRMRPQTNVYYSAEMKKNASIVTNSSAAAIFQLQKIGTDPMSLVLEFAFKHQVLEIGELKELTLLCKAFWETIYFVPFTISLGKEVKKIDTKKMSKLTNLKGIEIAWYPLNIKLMEHLLKLNGNLLDNLVIRYDYYNGKGVVIPSTFANSFKSLKYVDCLDSKKKKFDFSQMTSVDNFCLILHSSSRDYHEKMIPCFPPNLKKFCILRSNIDQYLKFPDILKYEHVTIIEPQDVLATNSIRRNLFVDFYLPASSTKTLTLIRLSAKQKKPDPLIPLLAQHEIIAKDVNGVFVVAASAKYMTNIMSLAEVAHKHLEVAFEEDSAVPNYPSNRYIDEHFKVFKSFFPDLVYSHDGQHVSPHY